MRISVCFWTGIVSVIKLWNYGTFHASRKYGLIASSSGVLGIILYVQKNIIEVDLANVWLYKIVLFFKQYKVL